MILGSVDQLEQDARKAEDAWRRSDFRTAFGLYAQAFNDRLVYSGYGVNTSVRLEAADFFVLERLSDLTRLLGNKSRADELLELAINDISKAGNDYWADVLRIKRIDLALGQGRLAESQTLLSLMQETIGDVRQIKFTPQGLTSWEGECRWSTASDGDRVIIFVLLYLVMGKLLAALGQYSQAEVALKRGLHYATQAPESSYAYPVPQDLAKLAIGPLKLALANTLLEKGELNEANTYLNQLKDVIDAEKQIAVFVQTLELEGKLAWLSGNLGLAVAHFRQVLTFCAERGFSRASVAATLNLAQVLILLNQTLDARRHLEIAREEARRANDLALVARAEWLVQLAFARVQSLEDGVPAAQSVTEQWDVRAGGKSPSSSDKEPSSAVGAFPSGINPFDLPQPDNYLAFFEERVLGFHWLLARRNFAACAHCLTQLQHIFSLTDSLLIKLRLQVLSGLLAYYQDNFSLAEKMLEASQVELRRLNLIPELWQTQRILGWCRKKLKRKNETPKAMVAENAGLLERIADSLEREDRSFFLFNKWTAEEEELALLINELSQRKADLDKKPWYRQLHSRWKLSLELERVLRVMDRYRDITAERSAKESDSSAVSENNSAERNLESSSFWQSLRQLKWRHATISFLVFPDRVLAVYRTRFALDFRVINVTRLELRELVREWHELVAQIKKENERDLGLAPRKRDLAHKTDDFMREVTTKSQQLADRLDLRLQLSSILKQLPQSTSKLTLVLDDCLHGFPFAALGYEGQHLIERYALSFAYHHLPAKVRRQGPRNILLVGASLSDEPERVLKYVPEELDSVADWAKRRMLMPQRFDDARPEYPEPEKGAILSTLPRSDIVHVACHGLFLPDQPAQSGIVLRSETDPGMISVQELSKLDLTNIHHITLSACWSADHFILPGRWVISLPDTLERAGAGSILGSLWVVNDRIGTAFIAQFYRYLDKYSRAEALRRTQVDCLKGTLKVTDAPDARPPIFWAGYQLYGQSGGLDGSRFSRLRRIWR